MLFYTFYEYFLPCTIFVCVSIFLSPLHCKFYNPIFVQIIFIYEFLALQVANCVLSLPAVVEPFYYNINWTQLYMFVSKIFLVAETMNIFTKLAVDLFVRRICALCIMCLRLQIWRPWLYNSFPFDTNLFSEAVSCY